MSLGVLVGIYPLATYMGIPGAALCVILSAVGMIAIWYPLSRSITQASWDKYANTLGPPLFSSLLMAGSIHLSRLYWDPTQQPLILAMSVFVGIGILSILIYVTIMYIIQLHYRSFDIVSDIRLVYRSLVVK